MKIEEAIKNCDDSVKRIKQYDPDPFYVKYFLSEFIENVNNAYDGIFEEANRDFGLFVTEKISEKTFEDKAKSKKDDNAMNFTEWYSEKFNHEHENPYPKIMNKLIKFRKKFSKLPNIKIMIRASDRYKDDIFQEITVNLSNQKLRSKEELEIEIKRQLPVFLEIINHKRNEKNEPSVRENHVIASSFLDMENEENIEILYACEIYIPVIKRIVEESRKKIKELTTWK